MGSIFKFFMGLLFLMGLVLMLYIFASPENYDKVSNRAESILSSIDIANYRSSSSQNNRTKKPRKSVNIPILMYHHVKNHQEYDDEVEKGLSVKIANFQEQMKYLDSNGYQTISLDQLFSDGGQKNIVITFDDGYKNVFTNAYPIMKEFDLTGTVFVITDFVGKDRYMNWDELRELYNAGWQIQSHSLTHPNLTNISLEEAWNQIYNSKIDIEKNISQIVTFLSYPAGKYNEEIIELIKKANYNGAVSTERGIENTQENIYHLKRERVGGHSSIRDFIGLLN
jgi:peptidoglycan/xylan/chitin deacetylase (PgdA/CDA1 family)